MSARLSVPSASFVRRLAFHLKVGTAFLSHILEGSSRNSSTAFLAHALWCSSETLARLLVQSVNFLWMPIHHKHLPKCLHSFPCSHPMVLLQKFLPSYFLSSCDIIQKLLLRFSQSHTVMMLRGSRPVFPIKQRFAMRVVAEGVFPAQPLYL